MSQIKIILEKLSLSQIHNIAGLYLICHVQIIYRSKTQVISWKRAMQDPVNWFFFNMSGTSPVSNCDTESQALNRIFFAHNTTGSTEPEMELKR